MKNRTSNRHKTTEESLNMNDFSIQFGLLETNGKMYV